MAWLWVAIFIGTSQCTRALPYVDDSEDIPLLDSLDDEMNIDDIIGDNVSISDSWDDGVTDNLPSIDDILDDEPIDVLLNDEANVDEISIDDLLDDENNIDEVSVTDLLDDEINIDEISVDDLLDNATNIDEINIDDLLDNELNIDDISIDDLLGDDLNVDDVVGRLSDDIEDADLGDLLSGGVDGNSDANDDDQQDSQIGTPYPSSQPTHSPSPRPTLAPTFPQIVKSSITIVGMTLKQAVSNRIIFAEAIAAMAGVEFSAITVVFTDTELATRRRLLEATKLVVTYMIQTSAGSSQYVTSAMENVTTTTATEALQETAEMHNRTAMFVAVETTSVSAVAVFSATAAPTTILTTEQGDGSKSGGNSNLKKTLLIRTILGIIATAAFTLCILLKRYMRKSHVAPEILVK